MNMNMNHATSSSVTKRAVMATSSYSMQAPSHPPQMLFATAAAAATSGAVDRCSILAADELANSDLLSDDMCHQFVSGNELGGSRPSLLNTTTTTTNNVTATADTFSPSVSSASPASTPSSSSTSSASSSSSSRPITTNQHQRLTSTKSAIIGI